MLNNQPELIRFLKHDGVAPDINGGFTLKATDDHLVLNGEFVHESVWGEITGSYANSDSGDMKLTMGSLEFTGSIPEIFLQVFCCSLILLIMI